MTPFEGRMCLGPVLAALLLFGCAPSTTMIYALPDPPPDRVRIQHAGTSQWFWVRQPAVEEDSVLVWQVANSEARRVPPQLEALYRRGRLPLRQVRAIQVAGGDWPAALKGTYGESSSPLPSGARITATSATDVTPGNEQAYVSRVEGMLLSQSKDTIRIRDAGSEKSRTLSLDARSRITFLPPRSANEAVAPGDYLRVDGRLFAVASWAGDSIALTAVPSGDTLRSARAELLSGGHEVQRLIKVPSQPMWPVLGGAAGLAAAIVIVRSASRKVDEDPLRVFTGEAAANLGLAIAEGAVAILSGIVAGLEIGKSRTRLVPLVAVSRPGGWGVLEPRMRLGFNLVR